MIELKVEFKKTKDGKVEKITKGQIAGDAGFVEDEMLEVLKTFDNADEDTLKRALTRFCDYKIDEEESD